MTDHTRKANHYLEKAANHEKTHTKTDLLALAQIHATLALNDTLRTP